MEKNINKVNLENENIDLETKKGYPQDIPEKQHSVDEENKKNREQIFNEEEVGASPNSYNFMEENRLKSIKVSIDRRKEDRRQKYKENKKKNLIFKGLLILLLIFSLSSMIFLYRIDKNIEKTIIPNQTISELNDKQALFTQTIDGITFDIYTVNCVENEITINYGIRNINDKFQPLIENSSLIPLNANDNLNPIKFRGLSQYNNMTNKFLLKNEATEGFITFNANDITKINEGYYQFKLPFYTENGLNKINIDFKV